MKKFYNYIFNLIRLDKTIRFHGTMDQLISMMDEMSNGQTCKQDLRVKRIMDKSYTIEPQDNVPLEMWTPISYAQQDGTINVKILPNNEEIQLIHCTTKIRPVLYSVLLFYIFILSFDIFFTVDGASTGSILGWSIFCLLALLIGNFYYSQKEKYIIGEFKKAFYILLKVSK